MAEIYSPVINLKFPPLNPHIVLWWLLKWYPELEEVLRQHGSFDSNEHTQLFDACVSNPYIEAIPVGSIHLKDIEQLML